MTFKGPSERSSNSVMHLLCNVLSCIDETYTTCWLFASSHSLIFEPRSDTINDSKMGRSQENRGQWSNKTQETSFADQGALKCGQYSQRQETNFTNAYKRRKPSCICSSLSLWFSFFFSPSLCFVTESPLLIWQ